VAQDGTPKITDFGLAKKLDDESGQTRTGAVMGTPSYMAPEQASGKTSQVGAAADVYALGAILYEMLTGRPPFNAATPMDTILQVIEEEVVSPRRLQPKVPRDLETITLTCLQKEPSRRYASAADLADDLRCFVEGKPIKARPVSLLEHAWRWCRRNSAIASSAAALLLLLISTAIGATVVAVRMDRLADSESKQRRRAMTTLVDSYASFAQAADAQKDTATAFLWFSLAAREAAEDPERQQANLLRARNWQQQLIVPAHAVQHRNVYRHGGSIFKALWLTQRQHFLVTWLYSNRVTVWDLSREQPVNLPGMPTEIGAVACAPDGNVMAVATRDGVAIFDIAAGERIGHISLPGGVNVLAFDNQGKRLAVGYESAIRLWNVVTGEFLRGEVWMPAGVGHASFNAAGTRLLARAMDDTVAVVDVGPDGLGMQRLPSSLLHKGSRGVEPLFLPGDAVLLVKNRSSLIWVDCDTGKQLREVAGPRGSKVSAVCQRGERIAVIWDDAVHILDAKTGASCLNRPIERPKGVLAIAFDPLGEVLAISGADSLVQFWSAASGAPLLHTVHLQSHAHWLQFASDGRSFLTSQENGHVICWKLPDPGAGDHAISMQGGSGVVLTADGQYLLPIGMTYRLATLNATQVRLTANGEGIGPEFRPAGIIMGGAFSPDGFIVALIASSMNDPAKRGLTNFQVVHVGGTLELWKWRDRQRVCQPIALPSEPRGVAFSPDGTRVAVICSEGDLILFDPRTGQAVHDLKTGITSGASKAMVPNLLVSNGALSFSPNGKRLATWQMDSQVLVWNVATREIERKLVHEDRAYDVRYSADGKWLATASLDKQVRVWNLDTGELAAPALRHAAPVTAARWANQEMNLITLCDDGYLGVWDWRNARVSGSYQDTHGSHDLAAFSNGRLLALASEAGLVRLFDKTIMKPITPTWASSDTWISATITPDEERLVMAGYSGTIHVMNLRRWLAPVQSEPEELVKIGELVTGLRYQEGGLQKLTPDEWFSRWKEYRHK